MSTTTKTTRKKTTQNAPKADTTTDAQAKLDQAKAQLEAAKAAVKAAKEKARAERKQRAAKPISWHAGQLFAEHGLDAKITDDLVAELNSRFGRETWVAKDALRKVKAGIRGFQEAQAKAK